MDNVLRFVQREYRAIQAPLVEIILRTSNGRFKA